MKKRIFSRVLALFMALAMLSTTALADVSFDAVQDAISGNTQNGEQITDSGLTDHYGYGKDETTGSFGVESWTTEGATNVKLNDNAVATETTPTLTVDENQKVNLDMNDNNITGTTGSDVIDVEKGGNLTITGGESADKNIISGGKTGIDVEKGGTLALDGVTVTGNDIGVAFVDPFSVTFFGDQNVVSGNKTKNIDGTGKVNFKLTDKDGKEVTYKVDAETAETLLANKNSVAAHGTDWILAKNGTVIYTGEGDNGKLTIQIVATVLQAAKVNNGEITGFVVSAGVKSMDKSAFKDQTGLTSVSLPEGLEAISSQAFYNCSSLTTINIPKTVKTVDSFAFYNCSQLQTIKIPDGVKTIATSAFQNCTRLDNVVLPKGLTTLAEKVFYGCSELKTITIPNTVESIGKNALNSCGKLTTITIPTSVKEIAVGALPSALKSIWVFPDATNDGTATATALAKGYQWYNVFVVGNGGAKLYRHENIVNFSNLTQDNFELGEDGNVSVKVPSNELSVECATKQTVIKFSVDEAIVTVNTDGKLLIPKSDKDVSVITTDKTDNTSVEWTVAPANNDGITLVTYWTGNGIGHKVEVPADSVITSSSGTSTTVSHNTVIGMDGKIVAREDITFADKYGNTVTIAPAKDTKVIVDLSTDDVAIPNASTVDDSKGGKTSYPSGATMKDGQITSKGNVAFENESENKIVVKPADVEEGEKLDPITVDPVTGTITVPNGGSTSMNDGKNEVSYPDGATADRQGIITSNGNVEYEYDESEGTVTAPEGSNITVGSDGTITVPEGGTIAGTEYPYGATILPNGDILENSAPRVELPEFTFDDGTTGAGDGDDTTTIDDEAIPLAGLISRAQLVSYLYTHEGSPDGEDAEGEYTLAWAWAVENGIEDEKNDPEETVTVAILREVMTNYAEFLGTTFDVVIKEADDMPVMNCDEILAEFFASLEDKAA